MWQCLYRKIAGHEGEFKLLKPPNVATSDNATSLPPTGRNLKKLLKPPNISQVSHQRKKIKLVKPPNSWQCFKIKKDCRPHLVQYSIWRYIFLLYSARSGLGTFSLHLHNRGDRIHRGIRRDRCTVDEGWNRVWSANNKKHNKNQKANRGTKPKQKRSPKQQATTFYFVSENTSRLSATRANYAWSHRIFFNVWKYHNIAGHPPS